MSGREAIHILVTIGIATALIALRRARKARAQGWLSGSPTGCSTLRTERGLTQAALAELVGVSRKTINTVENGVFVPSTMLALKLARALGRPVEELFSLVIPND